MPSSQRNTIIQDPICKVSIKSVQGSEFSDLQSIYATVSSIRLESRNSVSAGGFVATNKLKLNYPGKGEKHYRGLSRFCKDLYKVQVTTSAGLVFEISDENSPMRAKVTSIDDTASIEFSNTAITPFKNIPVITQPPELSTGFSFYL